MNRIVLFFLLGLLTSACAGEGGEPDPVVKPPPNELPQIGSVLFVGNSLTYTNELPTLVAVEANKKGYSMHVASITLPNSALEDHWQNGEVHKLLASTHFDFVVVQQGPSSQLDGKIMLREYGAKFKALCDQHGAKLAFFMVWPSKAFYSSFDGVIQNYTEAAELNQALLCPVGKAWKEHMDNTGDFSYYGPDLFHPSLTGSEVAASIIYNTLFP